MAQIKNKVEYLPIEDVYEYEGNPRTIKKADFERLKKSIKDNPDYFEARPLIISNRTGKNVIIAGNQRAKAAVDLGLKEVPAVILKGLTYEREREIMIRDNVNNGEWDFDILANNFDIDDLQEWGVDEIKPFKEIVEDEPAPVDNENTYSIVGDIYQLGEHRVFCGSFEDDEKVRELFGNKKATCTFTDPPYNVAYESADGKKIKNDSMAREEFLDFLSRAFNVVATYTDNGGGGLLAG